MTSTPSAIVFDFNETLSDVSSLGARSVDVDAPAYLARVWFATLLRDGFAGAGAGGTAKFSVIGSEILRGVLRDVALTRDRVTCGTGGYSWRVQSLAHSQRCSGIEAGSVCLRVRRGCLRSRRARAAPSG